MSDKPLREAVALVFREGDRVWAFRRSEDKEVYKGLWSIPSTYLEAGEPPSDAAIRLAKRKLGLQSIKIDSTALGNSGPQEKPDWFLDMSVYEVETYEGDITISLDEYVEMRLVTPAELKKLVYAQDVEDKGGVHKNISKE